MTKSSSVMRDHGFIDSLNLSVPRYIEAAASEGTIRPQSFPKILDGWLEEANERRRIKKVSQPAKTVTSRQRSAAAASSVSKEKALRPEENKLIRDSPGENDNTRGQQPVAEKSSRATHRVAQEQHLQARAENTITQPRQIGLISPAQNSNDAQGRKGPNWVNVNENAAYSKGGNWSSDIGVSSASSATSSGHWSYTDRVMHRSGTDHQALAAAGIGRNFAKSGHQALDYTGMEQGFAHTVRLGEQLPVNHAAAGRHQSHPCHQGSGCKSMGRDIAQSELLLNAAAAHDYNAGNQCSGYAGPSGSGHGYGERDLVQSQRMPSSAHHASPVCTQPAMTHRVSDSWGSQGGCAHGPATGWHQNIPHNQAHWPTESSNWQYQSVEQHTRQVPRDHVQQPQFSQEVRQSQNTEYLETHQMGENRFDSMLLTRFQPLEYGLRDGDELDEMDFGTW